MDKAFTNICGDFLRFLFPLDKWFYGGCGLAYGEGSFYSNLYFKKPLSTCFFTQSQVTMGIILIISLLGWLHFKDMIRSTSSKDTKRTHIFLLGVWSLFSYEKPRESLLKIFLCIRNWMAWVCFVSLSILTSSPSFSSLSQGFHFLASQAGFVTSVLALNPHQLMPS